MSNIEEDIMSEEAFNELIDNFEIVNTLTEYGRKAIKQNVKKLQKRIKELEEQVKILDEAYTGVIKESKKWFDIAHSRISKQKVKYVIKNETINISGFECIAVENLEELLEDK